MGTHQNRLEETILMSTHNIDFFVQNVVLCVLKLRHSILSGAPKLRRHSLDELGKIEIVRTLFIYFFFHEIKLVFVFAQCKGYN